ncbi:MAG: hypothetical protein V1867_02020 [Candidatus Falkowbacteria bacterium]
MGKEEEKEKKPSLFKLIQESGDLLGSRYVIELVEATRSPKAVDDHFVKLGWSNDTARQARNVARIYQYYPEEWKTLKDNGINQTEYHFRGGEKINLDPPNGYSLVCHNRFAIGEESVDISGWPEFLRGLALKREDGYSYDACFAEGSNFPSHVMGQQSRPLPGPFAENIKIIKNNMLHRGFALSFLSDGICARASSGSQHISFLKLQIGASFYQSAFLDSAGTPKLYSDCYTYQNRPDKQLEEVRIALGYDVNPRPARETSCGTMSLSVTDKGFLPIEVEMKMIFDVLVDAESKQIYLQGNIFSPISVNPNLNSKKFDEKPVPGVMKVVCEFMEKQHRIARSFLYSSQDIKDRSQKILSKLFGLESLDYDGSILDLFLN